MISAAQQRGRLRQLILRELRSTNLKAVFKNLLQGNNQDVTGFLQRSVQSSGFTSSLRVQSSIGSAGIIEDVRITIDAPWGRYGRQLDSTGSVFDPVTNPPGIETIVQWIKNKGLSANQVVRRKLKSGEEKTYVYNNTESARKHFAYHIVKNIASNERVSTTYDYASDIEVEFQFIINDAISAWYDEMSIEWFGDVEVVIGNLI